MVKGYKGDTDTSSGLLLPSIDSMHMVSQMVAGVSWFQAIENKKGRERKEKKRRNIIKKLKS